MSLEFGPSDACQIDSISFPFHYLMQDYTAKSAIKHTLRTFLDYFTFLPAICCWRSHLTLQIAESDFKNETEQNFLLFWYKSYPEYFTEDTHSIVPSLLHRLHLNGGAPWMRTQARPLYSTFDTSRNSPSIQPPPLPLHKHARGATIGCE